ncbi:MAG: pilus assembly protein [Silicimonas sp.]|nr:pilus assembly protein [Silicimonas sp.]
MSGRLKRIPPLLRTFRRRQDGTATVEAVLWFPIFIAVFGLMVDSAIIFHGQSKVLRVVQDANRKLSIKSLKTDAEVVAFINNELNQIGITPTTTVAQSDAITGIVSTGVQVPASELQLLGYFSVLTNLDLTVTAQHMREDWTG